MGWGLGHGCVHVLRCRAGGGCLGGVLLGLAEFGYGGRPRSVGRCRRVAICAAADVLRSLCGLAGRVLVDRVPFRAVNQNAAPRPGAGLGAWAQWRRSCGRVSPAASRPPPYHRGPPSGPVWPGRVTAYPVTWPGLVVLCRSQTSTPAGEADLPAVRRGGVATGIQSALGRCSPIAIATAASRRRGGAA
jgi:hypothetical protein